MTKVAVGVRVKADDDWATIMEVLPDGTFLVEWDECGPGVVPWSESDFHFDQPNDPLGPIRTETVTTRRLEPGVYGRATVARRKDPGNTKEVMLTLTGDVFSAPELRELARVALEIAEYLENA